MYATVHDSRTLGSLAGLITLCGCRQAVRNSGCSSSLLHITRRVPQRTTSSRNAGSWNSSSECYVAANNGTASLPLG